MARDFMFRAALKSRQGLGQRLGDACAKAWEFSQMGDVSVLGWFRQVWFWHLGVVCSVKGLAQQQSSSQESSIRVPSGCFHKLGVHFLGVLTRRALLFSVYVRAPDFCSSHIIPCQYRSRNLLIFWISCSLRA